MPCLTAPITEKRQLIVEAWVTDATLDFSDGAFHPEKHPHSQCDALLDTGANKSCIADRLARKLGLSVHEKQKISSISDSTESNVYRINIHVPFDALLRREGRIVVSNCFNMSVFGIPGIDDSFDLLLGLDYISQGSLHVAGDAFTFCI